MADSELQIYEAILNDELVRARIELLITKGTERNELEALLYLASAAVNRQPYLTAPKPGEADLFNQV